MSFTRTVNYTQNVPVSMGFTGNYFNPSPSRQVNARFILDGFINGGINMGTVNVPTTAGVTVQTGRSAINGSVSGSVVLTGDVAAVNTALNGCQFQNLFYEIEDVDQDFLVLTRSFGNQKGEMQIQIPPYADISGLVVGTAVTFSTQAGTTTPYTFNITKIDSSSSAIRIWLIYARDYNLSDIYYGSTYKTVNVTTTEAKVCYLKTTAGINIAPVIDISYGNPQGSFSMIFRTTDGATTEDSTINMVGSPQIAEPTFSTLPPVATQATLTQSWTGLAQMGNVAQANSNFQSIQLLIKTLENDPWYLDVTDYTALSGYPSKGTADEKAQFIGDKIDAKASLCIPKYIKDKTYGAFSDTQVDQRASVTYATESQEVRWAYYDTPTGINNALGRVYYWRPVSFDKDIALETRIVNGKSRIYANRGK